MFVGVGKLVCGEQAVSKKHNCLSYVIIRMAQMAKDIHTDTDIHIYVFFNSLYIQAFSTHYIQYITIIISD